MVETAGVEPASEKEALPVSTYIGCVRAFLPRSPQPGRAEGIPDKKLATLPGEGVVRPC